MKGRPSRRPSLSSVARIWSRLRTSTRSPALSPSSIHPPLRKQSRRVPTSVGSAGEAALDLACLARDPRRREEERDRPERGGDVPGANSDEPVPPTPGG